MISGYVYLQICLLVCVCVCVCARVCEGVLVRMRTLILACNVARSWTALLGYRVTLFNFTPQNTRKYDTKNLKL